MLRRLTLPQVPSAADSAAVCEIKADYLEAELRAQELLQLLIDELSRRAGRMVLIFRVLDLAGFSLAHHGTPNNSLRNRPALDYSFLPSMAIGKNLHINRVCFSEEAWHAAEQRGAAIEPIFRELRSQREQRGKEPNSA